jgi:hypothetical protein
VIRTVSRTSRVPQHSAFNTIERLLWWLTLFWGCSLIWLPERPPMADLGAHAGQITLLIDLTRGTSPWSDALYVNPTTPYLLGYGLTALVSVVTSVLFAVKLVLSIAYLGFVLAAVKVRQHFGSSHYLDWMIIPSFFGLSFEWGFFSFLVAAPIGMLFVLVVDDWLSEPARSRGWLVVIVGLILFAAHGLTFAFFLATAFVMTLVALRSADRLRRLVTALTPLIALSAASVVVFVIISRSESQLGQDFTSSSITFKYQWGRVLELLTNSFDSYLSDQSRGYDWRYLVVAVSFIAAPWTMGFKPVSVSSSVAMIPLVIVLAVAALVPSDALGTWLIYERFAQFLFPSYAWIFSAQRSASLPVWRFPLGLAALVLGCWFVMGVLTIQMVRFTEESAGFSNVLASMEPGEAAVYLVFDKGSAAYAHDFSYLHFASWYEAEKHGFVVPNLAFYKNMVVRFRKDREPKANSSGNIERYPGSFDWIEHEGDRYRYFIIRDVAQQGASVYFKGSPCLPHKTFGYREWQVYERSACAR